MTDGRVAAAAAAAAGVDAGSCRKRWVLVALGSR